MKRIIVTVAVLMRGVMFVNYRKRETARFQKVVSAAAIFLMVQLCAVPFAQIYTEWPFDANEAVRRQNETAQNLGIPVEKNIDLGDGVYIELVLIPAGEFMMGSSTSAEETFERSGSNGYPGFASFERSHPQHRVRLTEPFYICKYELTQDVWEKAMGTEWDRPALDNQGNVLRPVDYKGARRPVDRASMGTSPDRDCLVFLVNLNNLVQGTETFGLPTEAQWEYVCRAGTATPFYFGESITTDSANVRGQWSPWDGNYGIDRRNHLEVGSLPPNAWGLYGMHGSVWEWVADRYEDYTADLQTDPIGSGTLRNLRGGAFGHTMAEARSAFRRPVNGGYQPNDADVGFRVMLPAPLSSPVIDPGIYMPASIDHNDALVARVFDCRGALVRTLQGGQAMARWDGRNSRGRAVVAGQYVIRIRPSSTSRATHVKIVPR